MVSPYFLEFIMYINFRWFAYPCWAYAIYCAIYAIYIIAITWGTIDIGPLVGIGVGVYNFIHAGVSSLLGALIWRAFRPDKKDIENGNEKDNK